MDRTTLATPGFLDRLGDRVLVTDRAGSDLEVLRFHPEIAADPAFEACLKARAEELAAFQHRGAARVRGISRLPAPDGRLAMVSDAPRGWRLSEVLQAAEHEHHLIHTSAVLFVLRQIASVTAALQAAGDGLSHGALGPERVVITPTGRVYVAEYVLGSALVHLPSLAPDRLWKELRIAVPGDESAGPFGPHTDVLQLGIIALSLVHNRLLRREEYPARLVELLDTATESRLTGARQPIGERLRAWLEQALGLRPGGATGRWTMEEAQRGLDWIVSKEGGYFSTPVGLEPLLQSVDRFFTVPPATDESLQDALPATGPVARPSSPAEAAPIVEPPSTERAHAETRLEETPHAAAPAEARRQVALLHQKVVTAEAPAEALPGEVAPPEMPPAVITTVAAPAPTAPVPLAALVTTSPLAVAEPVANPFPVPADIAPRPTPRPALRVVPPRPDPAFPAAPAAPPAEVAPVADMLSVDRPSTRHRTGWNSEAWLSRSADRQPSGARTVATGSGPSPRAASGGTATAAAAALVAAPATEPPPAPTPTVTAVSSSPARDDRHVAATPPASRGGSLFGFSGGADDEQSQAEEDRAGSGGRGKMKWLAVAAAIVICAAALAGWALLKPGAGSAAGADSEAAAAKQAIASQSKQAAASPRDALVAPAPGLRAVEPASADPARPAAAEAAVVPPAEGGVQLLSPVVVAVSEGGERLGTSAAALTLPAGRHVLTVANEEIGYRGTLTVDVRQGRLSKVAVTLPRGSVNINATPWAEVFVDGQRVGETPLGNVEMVVGSHEVRFRHPQLGEQVRTVVVATGAPGRLSVDMKQ